MENKTEKKKSKISSIDLLLNTDHQEQALENRNETIEDLKISEDKNNNDNQSSNNTNFTKPVKNKNTATSNRQNKNKKYGKIPIPEKYYKEGRTSNWLPTALVKKAKMLSITNNLSLEYIVTEALYEYLLKTGEIKNDEREKGQ